MKRILCVQVAAGVAISVLVMGPAPAADTRLACNITNLERSQIEARGNKPALLGAVPNTMTPVPINGVYVSDDAIRRKVLPQEVFVRRTENGSVELIARIANCTDFPLQVLGRASFMDAQQFPTENVSAWQLIMLQPRSLATFREVSIGRNDDVGAFLIELRGNR